MQDHFVLYLNLWGTVAKLLDPDEAPRLGSSGSPVDCQRHFNRILASLASRDPATKVFCMGDFAYAIADDPMTLVEFASEAFREMTQHAGKFELWPLRGAVARGARLDVPHIAASFFDAGLSGEGINHAARLEKQGLKGFRLFLSNELGESLAEKCLVREGFTSAGRYFEVNWMDVSYLEHVVEDQKIDSHLRSRSLALFEEESNYCRQLASSIRDLLSWRIEGRKLSQREKVRYLHPPTH